VLVQQNVIADLGSLANHHTHAVIDEATRSNGGARVNFNARCKAGELRQDTCRQRKSCAVHLVPQPVQQNGMKTGIAEENFDGALRGRIAAENRVDLLPDGSEHDAYTDYLTARKDAEKTGKTGLLGT